MVKSRGKRTAKRRDQHVEILWEEDMRETSVTRAEKEGELAGEAGCGGGVGWGGVQQNMHGLGPHSGFWSLSY